MAIKKDTRRDIKEVQQFFRDFKNYPKDVQKATRPMLRQSVDKPLAQARQNAAWSTRIPRAIRPSLRFTKRFSGAALIVNKNRAPHGRPWENRGRKGTFRHRVFGQNVWVTEQARPFFYGVAEGWHDDVVQKLGQTIDHVSRSHGFK